MFTDCDPGDRNVKGSPSPKTRIIVIKIDNKAGGEVVKRRDIDVGRLQAFRVWVLI